MEVDNGFLSQDSFISIRTIVIAYEEKNLEMNLVNVGDE